MARFALVRWVSGEDKGKFSTNVPVEWIRDFNGSVDDDEDESYLIEWRVGKKPGPAG